MLLALTLASLLALSAADTNVVVVGGSTDEGYPLFSAEILEQTTSCAIRDYPRTVYGSAGALLNPFHILVCGGFDSVADPQQIR